jgi:predicted PurR-regulated permease PerM
VDTRTHFTITATALKNWFIAQAQDALAVGVLWLIGLLILRVPWAVFWALLGGLLQFIPHLGPVLGLIGPAVTAGISGGWERMLYVLILYAIIVVVDGLVLQPYLMRRSTRVPIWASVLTPIVLGFVLPFWGVFLAPPLLAVLWAYRARNREELRPEVEIIPPQPRIAERRGEIREVEGGSEPGRHVL